VALWADPRKVAEALASYRRLPFASDSVPGAFAEAVLALHYEAIVLRTYDFADVVSADAKVGWQVKSTMAATPVTWKRAKIPNAPVLIEASLTEGGEAVQALGDAVIEFCNAHARESLEHYDLDEIRYARVICHADRLVFFERTIVTRGEPILFKPEEFAWKWSEPKKATVKEQLRSLHGMGPDGKKWFAAHLLGENQLHFSGESAWWPTDDKHPRMAIVPFAALPPRIEWEQFVEWVSAAE
jgi:hypothetical protein